MQTTLVALDSVRTGHAKHLDCTSVAKRRMLVERFGFPWQHVAPDSLTHFYSAFTVDETVPLGTWQATPFEVAAMLEKGFRGSSLTPDQLILTWSGKPLAPAMGAPSPGLSQALLKLYVGQWQ